MLVSESKRIASNGKTIQIKVASITMLPRRDNSADRRSENKTIGDLGKLWLFTSNARWSDTELDVRLTVLVIVVSMEGFFVAVSVCE